MIDTKNVALKFVFLDTSCCVLFQIGTKIEAYNLVLDRQNSLRSKLLPIADRAADLLFLVQNLHRLSPLYSFPANFLINIFKQVLQRHCAPDQDTQPPTESSSSPDPEMSAVSSLSLIDPKSFFQSSCLVPFPSEFSRRNECQFRLNKTENRQRATQLCQKENQFCMNEFISAVAKLNLTQKSVSNLAKFSFILAKIFFTKAKLKFVHAILIFILAKFNFILAKLTWKRRYSDSWDSEMDCIFNLAIRSDRENRIALGGLFMKQHFFMLKKELSINNDK